LYHNKFDEIKHFFNHTSPRNANTNQQMLFNDMEIGNNNAFNQVEFFNADNNNDSKIFPLLNNNNDEALFDNYFGLNVHNNNNTDNHYENYLSK